jgi:hypothetical protein
MDPWFISFFFFGNIMKVSLTEQDKEAGDDPNIEDIIKACC